MTTDMFPKITSAKIGNISIAGIAKGAGMIHPNMATMLSVLATDAKISPACLDQALRYPFNTFTSIVLMIYLWLHLYLQLTDPSIP